MSVEDGGVARAARDMAQRAHQERLARVPPGWYEEQHRRDLERLRSMGAGVGDDAASAQGAGLPQDRGTLLVRTDFTRQDRWQALLDAVRTPSEDDFLPALEIVEDLQWRDASVEDLVAAAPASGLIVVADAAALASAELPVLVVNVEDGVAEELRVTPAALWSIENNLSIANMDWEDFTAATGPDGVFRGFD
ncbi:hypothetical protein CLV92_1272 [Kineococcus xinjiangensis]|uniref:DUF6924 domain-containing protein n=1 Tax=Kineococcus xinjiangensis TaxID=512762 RepID=A0A2S6IBV9_9ACTN|nr:hypothetical protein [Kineococcus xinjiangensis]PPK90182.1 hypothetical protein CLV92_1272 [Kineococcus xinjiangensis]